MAYDLADPLSFDNIDRLMRLCISLRCVSFKLCDLEFVLHPTAFALNAPVGKDPEPVKLEPWVS